MHKEVLLDTLKIQLADYQNSKDKEREYHMQGYYQGKINATLDIIDRVHILYWE